MFEFRPKLGLSAAFCIPGYVLISKISFVFKNLKYQLLKGGRFRILGETCNFVKTNFVTEKGLKKNSTLLAWITIEPYSDKRKL